MFRRLAQGLGLVSKVRLWPVEVGVLHKRMRSDCPAAAYLFAVTISNSKALLLENAIPPTSKLKHIDDELAFRSGFTASNIDAGLGDLGLRFIRAVIADRKRWRIRNATSTLVEATCGDLRECDRHYRDLQPRDRLPPVSQSAVAVLAKRDRKTVGELADAIIAEYETGIGTPQRAEESIQSILAFFDLRDEMARGELAKYLRALDRLIPQL